MLLKNFWNSKQRNTIAFNRGRNTEVEVPNNNSGHNRLSWPQFYQRNRNNLTSTNSKIPVEDRHSRESGGSSAFERVLCPDEARVMQKANQIVMYVQLFIQVYAGGGNWISYVGVLNRNLDNFCWWMYCNLCSQRIKSKIFFLNCILYCMFIYRVVRAVSNSTFINI